MTRGWIFYDSACSLCMMGRQRTGRLFESRGFEWVPLQTPGAAARLGVSETAFDIRMHLLATDGRVLHNADAFSVLCRSVWWLWPLGSLLLIPGFREMARLTYDWFARNRYCFSGTCRVDANTPSSIKSLYWIFAIILPVVAGFILWQRPSWLMMWEGTP